MSGGDKLKTLGIIGGIGPESTVEYYRLVIQGYRARRRDEGYPRILINSVDFEKVLRCMERQDLSALTDYLVDSVTALGRGGADVGLLAANAPHVVFEEVRRRSPVPLISIVEATCEAVRAFGLEKVGLLGARFTMQGRFYPDVFGRAGIALVIPEDAEREEVHRLYFGELVEGVFRAETRERFVSIIERMVTRYGVEGVILGGTELPLLFREGRKPDIPLLDTTRIHAERAVEHLLS